MFFLSFTALCGDLLNIFLGSVVLVTTFQNIFGAPAAFHRSHCCARQCQVTREGGNTTVILRVGRCIHWLIQPVIRYHHLRNLDVSKRQESSTLISHCSSQGQQLESYLFTWFMLGIFACAELGHSVQEWGTRCGIATWVIFVKLSPVGDFCVWRIGAFRARVR